MSEFRVNKITNRSGYPRTVLAGITTFSGTSGIVMPGGSLEYRGGRGRAVFNGGYEAPAVTSEIQKVEIATTGNATNFGDLSSAKQATGSLASSTRGICAGGAPAINVIDYIVMASEGGSWDFGDLTRAKRSTCGAGSETRGLFFGANTPTRYRDIDYITIASKGNASEFGELAVDVGSSQGASSDDMGGCSSPIRSFCFGTGGTTNVIQYVTTATLGNSQDFGDLTQGNVRFPSGCSSTTRGLSGGGVSPSDDVNIIEYFTMATLGNASNFGDLVEARQQLSAASSHTRGLFAGGYDYPVTWNIIEKVEIATTGDATDFGDLTYSGQTNGASKYFSACSDCNGGLAT